MKYAKIEEEVKARANKTGGNLPESVANSPELGPGLLYYFLVWQELSTDRQLGFSVGPIPNISIRNYTKEEGLSVEEAYDLRHHLLELDKHYLNYCAEQSKKKQSEK